MAPEDPDDYESDPEELNRSLATRRREASDDDDDDDDDTLLNHNHNHLLASALLHSDHDDSYEEADFAQLVNFIPDHDDDEHDDDDDAPLNHNHSHLLDSDHDDFAQVVDFIPDNAPVGVAASDLKKKEPFAVPTAGAFYMHDDRFQEFDDAASSNRRMRGGRRLWQSRDESKWGHDKYEQLNTPQENQFQRRTSRGRVRGRGQARRGAISKPFTGNGHQNQFPKALTRGRGPRRYEVAFTNGNQAPSVQTKQSQNSFVNVSHANSERPPTETASLETEAILSKKKNVLASSLNSASPPFYPSGSSNNLAPKDLQTGIARLHISQNPTPSGKKFGSTKSTSSWVRTAQPSQTTSHARDAPLPGQMLYQQSPNQGDKVSSLMHIQGMPTGTDQSCTQPPQASDLHSAVNSLLPPSPPKTTGSSENLYISSGIETDAETGALVAKGGKGSLQPSGRGSFMYGGTQFMAAGHGNSNFPAFLPVMQFAGQHGGVPTFGMALPGYVQPEHGTGNPEMTWLPILPGPGALGGSYCPPYAAIDGSYQAHKPMLPSSAGSSSEEKSCNNPNDEQPMMRPDTRR